MSETGDGTELQKLPSRANGDVIDSKSEKVTLLESKHRVSAKAAVKLRKAAIIISWISLVTTLAQGILALAFAIRERSESILGFGIDAVLDAMTSVVVLWRFYSADLYSEAKERRACVVIGILFLISSLFLAGKTIFSFVQERRPYKDSFLWILSVINGVLNLIIGICKLVVGYKLESKSLMTDSIVTLVGSATSFAAVLAIYLFIHDVKLWYIDDIFGIVCSIFLLIYAIVLFWFNCSSIRGSGR